MPKTHRTSRIFRRVRRNSDGVAALEFAIVGPIFLALCLAILEAGLLCTRIALVDHALTKASKYIYLGPQDGVSLNRTVLENYVCDYLGSFVVDCTENLTLELTPITNFRSPPEEGAPCRDKDLELDPAVVYNPGGSNSIVYMRVCLTTPVVTPGLGLGMALNKTESNKFEIVSSLAFVNEPF